MSLIGAQSMNNSCLPVFLHVGCGPQSQSETPFADKAWREIRLDIDSSVHPDVVGTMTDMAAVGDGTVDAVYSSHNIEHLYPHEVPIALDEFRRVLKPEGFVLITCPDLLSVCRLIAEDKLCDPAYESGIGPVAPLDILYGHGASLQKGNLYMAHRCGFTAKVLGRTLRQAGFLSAVKSRSRAFDIWAIGAVNQSEEWLLKHANHFFPA